MSLSAAECQQLFEWGYNEFGTYNEDFLSATQTDVPGCNEDAYDPYCEHMVHEGGYTELQVGPARTQMHTFPIGAESVFEWTEHFKAWRADPATLHATDYHAAVDHVNEWMASDAGITKEALERADEVLRAIADVPPAPEQIVSRGLPWGGLQEKLLATLRAERAAAEGTRDGGALEPARLAPGCPFPPPEETDETRPWLELLTKGTFSNATLTNLVPLNFEVSDRWLGRLAKSLADGHESWLHYLCLGTHALEVGNVDGARTLLAKSMALQPTVRH